MRKPMSYMSLERKNANFSITSARINVMRLRLIRERISRKIGVIG